MPNKLTPAQERVLRELCAPKCFAERHGNYWYAFTAAGVKRETLAVKALVSAGLLVMLPFARAIVNADGRALLAELDGEKTP